MATNSSYDYAYVTLGNGGGLKVAIRNIKYATPMRSIQVNCIHSSVVEFNLRLTNVEHFYR